MDNAAPQEPTEFDFKAMSAKFTVLKSWTNKTILDDSSLLFESTLNVFDTKFKVQDSEIWAENGYTGINTITHVGYPPFKTTAHGVWIIRPMP